MTYLQKEQEKLAWIASVDDCVTNKVPAIEALIANLPNNPGAPTNVFSVKSFGAVGDGVADDTLALHAARDFIAAQAFPPRLVFPAGIYKYTQSPNWAIPNAVIDCDGEVRLRYVGTDKAVILNAGAGLVYNVVFGLLGRFIIETENGDGIFLQSVHASEIRARVAGCGLNRTAFEAKFSVCSKFDVVVSVNQEGWYENRKPLIGYNLGQRNAGETVSYCTFVNPIVEGPQIGIQLLATLGNIFLGGTSEACSQYGVYAAPLSSGDKFIGTDFEANGIADIYCVGRAIKFQDCDTYDNITFGAGSRFCTVNGGEHSLVNVEVGSLYSNLVEFVYNRFGNGAQIINGGTGTHSIGVRNGATGVMMLMM